jgi:hypothetical protein
MIINNIIKSDIVASGKLESWNFKNSFLLKFLFNKIIFLKLTFQNVQNHFSGMVTINVGK